MNWRHASAHQLRRVLVGADGNAQGLLGCVDEVLQQCEVAGNPSVSSFNEKLQVDLLSLDDMTAIRATDVYSKYPLAQARSNNPLEVRGAFCESRTAVFGRPRSRQMDGRLGVRGI